MTMPFRFDSLRTGVRILACSSLLISMPACAQDRIRLPMPTGTPGRWALEPTLDAFSPNALLDLRSLNEREAGESGFVRVDANGDFLLGNGKPVRFWACNTDVGREKPYVPRPLWRQTEPDLARHARFLAKRGVNMVRCHSHVNPDANRPPTEINTKERDWIWRTVAAMKKEGIYTTISPYWAVTGKIGAGWNVPGGEQEAFGLVFFDETLQGYYKNWLRQLFAEKNPYTGIPLSQDPSVAIIQLQNEDSLLFWTINNLKPEQKRRLGKKFGDWAIVKYGSLNAAFRAWENAALAGDDRNAGVLDLYNVWEMTQDRQGGMQKRLADQLEFWSRTMYNFNREMGEYLRNELGAKQVVNAGNWRTADTGRLNDAERWSYTANEVLAVNRYIGGLHTGPNQGWAIVNGDQFTSPSILKDPFPFPLNLKQAKGRAMMVTESAWVMPNGRASEGPFLISVYQSLTGVDAYYWFATIDEQWTPPQSANGYMPSQQKWMFANPDMLGTFPAAALLYRKGYVKRGQPVVVEQRALTDLWERRTPLIAEESGYDPNRDSGNLPPTSSVKQVLQPQAFFAGPVEVVYGGNPALSTVADLSQLVDYDKKIIRSITGEVTLNYGKGVCRVDTAKAQGFAAFFPEVGGRLACRDLEVTTRNEFGSVLAVAMDDLPLRTSKKVLVQVGTQSRPTDWKETPVTITVNEGTFPGFRVDNYGKAPWQIVSPLMNVKLTNRSVTRATVLDANGMSVRTIPLQRRGQEVWFTFPGNALYVLLQ